MLLSQKHIDFINKHIGTVFAQLLINLLGGNHERDDGKTTPSIDYMYSLPGIYLMASNYEGAKVNPSILASVISVVGDYVSKHKEDTKAAVKIKIQSEIDKYNNGTINKEELKSSIEKTLNDVAEKLNSSIEKIVNSETRFTQNMSIKDAIDQFAENANIDDPVLVWVHPLDDKTCESCLRLYYLPDGNTPRVWKASEVNADYYKKGEPNPSWHLAHPHCRGALSHVMPGFGFDAQGRITWIDSGYSEWDYQRGFKSRPTPGVQARRKKYLTSKSPSPSPKP